MPITTIVHFSVPAENMDAFLASWRKTQDLMLQQPGALDGVMHRALDADAPFQFVNVARWESAEALAKALKAASEARKASDGTDVMADMQRLGARSSQNNYDEEQTYEARR